MNRCSFARVAVTGGSGRLGRHVVEACAAAAEVTVLDIAAPPEDVRHAECDVRDIDAVRAGLGGCEAVIHLAALDDGIVPEEEAYIDVNLRGTWNVLQAAEEAGVRRVVIASSVAAVGIGPEHPPAALPMPVETELLPRQSYGLTKKVCEEMARAFVRRGSLEVICLRPCLVAQPDITWSMAAIAASTDGTAPPPRASNPAWRELREPLGMTRAFVSPGDAARAFRAALEVGDLAFGIFWVTGPDTCSALATAEVIERESGGAPRIADAALYRRLPTASAFDLEPARRVLGWTPQDRWADHLAGVIGGAGSR